MKHRHEGRDARPAAWAPKPRTAVASPVAVLVVSLLAAMAVLASSCAYYNTFYSARRYYNQALRSNRQPARPGPGGSSQSTGISGQTSGLLDKSIEKCAKVITFYPKSKWVDDAIFLMGQSYFLKQDYDKALKKYQDLAVYYPKSEFVPRSAFMVGQCDYGKREYDLAIQVLQKALVEYPRIGASDRNNALFTVGESYLQKKDYPDALVNYRLLTGSGRKSELYFKSQLKAADCYFELARYDSARVCLSSVVRDDRNDEEVLAALIKTGDCYAAEKNLDSAARSYKESEELAKEFGKMAVVQLKTADVELARQNYEKAIELYGTVVADFPRTIYASEAQFRIGYIYEVHLEDLDQAAQAYGKVKDQMPKSEYVSQAEYRGKGLARLKESGKKAGASEADKAAEPDFMLAELSLFQLGKTDKAIEKYLSVENTFPTSAFAPKSGYAVTYAFLNMKHDTASAIDAGRRVIEKFPNTEYAEAAGKILTSLNVEMSPELLQKTIPPKPVPADSLRKAAAADSLRKASEAAVAASSADTLGSAAAARIASPAADSLRAAVSSDSLKAAAARQLKARADSLGAARPATGMAAGATTGASLPDSLKAPSRPVGQGASSDSLAARPPAPAETARADSTVAPEPERPEILGKDEAEQDTTSAK